VKTKHPFASSRLRGCISVIAVLCVTAIAHAQFGRIPVDLTPLTESDAPAGRDVRLALTVQLPAGYHVQSNAPKDPSLIPTVLSFDAPAGVSIDEIVFPATTELKLQGTDEPLAVFEQEFTIGIRAHVAAGTPAGPLTLPATIRYQACDETTCYAPNTAATEWSLTVVPAGAAAAKSHPEIFDAIKWGTGGKPEAAPSASAAPSPAAAPGDKDQAALDLLDRFTIAGTTGGYLGSADFLQFIHDAEAGVEQRGMFEGRGPLAILLLVLVGGLALNLTPCVLPMIPINLAIIGAGSQAGSRARGFLLGGVYGAAMAIVYGVLGLVVILTAGTFGTINASPWFNLGIAALFVVLGLAMFDVLMIDFSRWSARFNPSAGRGTFALAFSMGAVAALLAGACVAPVVIQVVLFSSDLYAKGAAAALALPFVLGVGMAIPWPIAGAGIASLPKPGPWMVRVKQALGVIILATAAYYGYEAYSIFANRWVNPEEVEASVQALLAEGWHARLADGLAEAEREQKPVLIDMWATWCKNCLTMDATTMKNPEVVAALDDYVKIKFQAESPDDEPAASVMRRLNASGLPTYVILRAPGAGNRGSGTGTGNRGPGTGDRTVTNAAVHP
jgi:thiol:disulfide interchange protein